MSVSDTFRAQSPLHIVVATFHLKDPSLADELLSFLNHGLDVTRDFKGCRLVEVSVSEDKTAIILYQKWVSRAAYDVYMQFRREEGALGPIMAKCCAVPPITVTHADLSSI
jgi:quinol monooxygenase YgiN